MSTHNLSYASSARQSPSTGQAVEPQIELPDPSPEHGGSEMGQQSVRSRDKSDYYQKKPTMLEYILHASKKSGRSPISVALEFGKVSRGVGRLSLQEYVQYGVYDPALSLDEKARFVTLAAHWPITSKCCDMTWQAATEDKWLCSHILEPTNISVPETLAVIDKTNRSYPGTLKITNAAELRDFALAQDGEPFFAKDNRGIASWGALLATEAEEDRLYLKGEGWVGYEDLMDRMIGTTPYLLQTCQRNHSFFDQYTDNLATVRVCVLLTAEGCKIPFAVLKLPSRENIADSFWRPGNLACNLDPATGKILDARSKDALGTKSYMTHPQSDVPLVGEVVPEWDQLLELVQTCSPIFAPVPYQSMDIAVTVNGPVLIEINTGGGFDLLQLASGRGFLTDEVRDFLRCHGYEKL